MPDYASDKATDTYTSKIDISRLTATSSVVYSRIKSVDKDGAISYTNVFTNHYTNK
jgi:hypothetical protein